MNIITTILTKIKNIILNRGDEHACKLEEVKIENENDVVKSSNNDNQIDTVHDSSSQKHIDVGEDVKVEELQEKTGSNESADISVSHVSHEESPKEEQNNPKIKHLQKELNEIGIQNISTADYDYLNQTQGLQGGDKFVPIWDRIGDASHSKDKDILAFAEFSNDKIYKLYYSLPKICELFEFNDSPKNSPNINHEELEKRLNDLTKIQERCVSTFLVKIDSIIEQKLIIYRLINVIEERKFIESILQPYYIEKRRVELENKRNEEQLKIIKEENNKELIKIIRVNYDKKDIPSLKNIYHYFKNEIGKHCETPLVLDDVKYTDELIKEECQILLAVILEKENAIKYKEQEISKRRESYKFNQISTLKELLLLIEELLKEEKNIINYNSLDYTREELNEDLEYIKEQIKEKEDEVLHQKLLLKKQKEVRKQKAANEAAARNRAWKENAKKAKQTHKYNQNKGLSEFEKYILGENKRWV